MGCCGQNTKVGGGKCTLCGASCKTKDYSPWGAKRVICWRCKDKQLYLIKEREKATARAKRLMSGVGE